MNEIKLKYPTLEMEEKALEFKKEFFDKGERMISGSYKLDSDKHSYKEWLQIIKDNLVFEKHNPKFGISHTLFAFNNEGCLVGIVNLRKTITDFYKDSGHIGYSVRPSERNKGYATKILNQVLEIAREEGLKEILLVCRKSNEHSRKTIIRNGGVIYRTFDKDSIEYEEYKIIL